MGATREPGAVPDPQGAPEQTTGDATASPPAEPAAACGQGATSPHAGDPVAGIPPDPDEIPALAPDIVEGDVPATDAPPPVPPTAPDETLAEPSPAVASGDTTPPASTPAPAGALPPPSGESVAAVSDDAVTPLGDDFYLDELVLPSAIAAPESLPAGTTIGPDGSVLVEALLDTRGRVNRYHASVRQGDATPVPAELREAPADHPDLRREAEVLANLRYAMLPQLLASFEQEGRRYLAVARHEGRETLADALAAGLSPDRAISVVLQLTQALRRLHAAGWALLGLQPAQVVLGDPLRITSLGTAARIGQHADAALSVAGYSAPETAHRAVVTGKEDVYTLGALLYRALAGAPVPEQGAELAALSTAVPLPGVPQLLDAALAPAEARADLETFYRQLLAFKARRSHRALQLEFAGGTSVGLNRTRPVNEDAYTATAWTIAHHDRASYRALLCVVDGMGGMEAGEVASTAAVRAVLQSAMPGSDAAPPDPVALVQAAARSVHEAAQGRSVGATITCVIVDDGTLTMAHVGDTRAYLLRDGALTQLTQDHSLVAAMVASGVLTKEQARGHPDSNQVLRSLGGQRALPPEYIDTLAATHGEPTLRLREGDRLLLCSDGIWGVLDDTALRDLLLSSDDCSAIVQAAIEGALRGGAPDNATLIVARCVPLPSH